MPVPPASRNDSSEDTRPTPPWMVVPPKMPDNKPMADNEAGIMEPEGTAGIPEDQPVPPEPVFGGPAEPGFKEELTPPPEETLPPETGESLVKKSPFAKIMPIFLGLLVIFLVYLLVKNLLLPLFIKKSGNGQVKEPVTLTYWGLWEEKEIIGQLITDYQTENPHVTINYLKQSPKDYRERLQSAFARKEGPDIFRFHNTWVPMLKKELASAPAAVFSQKEFEETFYQVMVDDLVSQGSIYGIPLMYDGLALFYNPRLLESAGKAVPESWDQLRQTAKEITVYDTQGKIQLAGVALGTTENVEHFSDILGLMILQNGADPAKPNSQLTQGALTFYTFFKTKDHVWDETLPNSIYAFATEKVAMILAPSWQAFTIADINPGLKFKTAKVPQLPKGEIAWASYWVEGVSSQSEHQEEAFKFLKYLTSLSATRKFFSEASKIRQFGEPYSRADLVVEIKDQPIVGAFVEQAPYAKSWYLASRTYDNGLNDRLIKYYQDAVNALIQGQSETAIFETLQSGVTQVLSQYNL